MNDDDTLREILAECLRQGGRLDALRETLVVPLTRLEVRVDGLVLEIRKALSRLEADN